MAIYYTISGRKKSKVEFLISLLNYNCKNGKLINSTI